MNEIVINQLREIADQTKEDEGRKSVLLEAARLLENYDKNKESMFAVKINTNAAVLYALTEEGLTGYINDAKRELAERFKIFKSNPQPVPRPNKDGITKDQLWWYMTKFGHMYVPNPNKAQTTHNALYFPITQMEGLITFLTKEQLHDELTKK